MLQVVIPLVLAFATIVFLLMKKVWLGLSVLAGGLIIWAFASLSIPVLGESFVQAAIDWKTWDIVLCMYFVMCLEAQLRLSGILTQLVSELRNVFSSNKVTLAFIPALLGLLPSVGGARFSAPIVAESSKGIAISPEDQSAANYWFRHIFEFCSPLIPGMILACAIANVKITDLIFHLAWVSIICAGAGWFYIIQPLKISDPSIALRTNKTPVRYSVFFLALGPILLTFLLTLTFNFSASLSLGLSVLVWFPLLILFKYKINPLEVFKSAFDLKLNIDLLCIMAFIQILVCSGFLNNVEEVLRATNWAPQIIIGCLAFITGLLTGLTQGYIAMTVPVAALLMPGNLELVGIAMIYGMAGQMLTPTHVCALVTVDYFKPNVAIFGKKVFVLMATVIVVYTAYTILRHMLLG